MIQSMPRFAAGSGSQDQFSWTWDLRCVISKGRDLCLRVPEWISGLEAKLRYQLSNAIGRGAVTLSLRITANQRISMPLINQEILNGMLTAMTIIETEAMEHGLFLLPSNAANIIALPGLFHTGAEPQKDITKPSTAVMESLRPVLESMLTMRAAESAALLNILAQKLDRLAVLTNDGATEVEVQKAQMAQMLQRNIETAMGPDRELDGNRLAQEIASLVVKADITEEIVRLNAHTATAREKLAQSNPVGGKLDFLMQEYNCEAITLCPKSPTLELTALGLEMKTFIDQMREQVQNVE